MPVLISAAAISDKSVLLTDRRTDAGFNLARFMVDVDYLSDCDSAGGQKAVEDGSKFDVWSSFAVVLGSAIPVFSVCGFSDCFAGGTLSAMVSVTGTHLPTTGNNSARAASSRLFISSYYALPVTAMVVSGFAGLTILTKNSFLEELEQTS